ncbi:hypothetical protein COV19_02715 [Candidatus Woesearchaeota archaeon CG10_big_fil_rev_8_21_14_0_10_44_13]|nr:MAG: hypothetical protein COV19_02715 [Candidatus Woesearchaeota archaeon CG10_big_fil_rev_8_21_14_0_10_44_13]
MISIVLISPITPGNIGAIARAMKNFDFKELILVNPRCDHISKEAMDRASHAKDILKKAKKMAFNEVLERFDYIVGTTSKISTDYNIPRCPISPEQFAEKLDEIKGKTKFALLFGNESFGLTNKEIDGCDFMITVPSSKDYPALNLSHSAAIILYEIYARKGRKKVTKEIWPITNKEKKQIAKMVDNVLDSMIFETKERKDTQRKVWKKMVGKSFMTRREAYALMGFLKKILQRKFR